MSNGISNIEEFPRTLQGMGYIKKRGLGSRAENVRAYKTWKNMIVRVMDQERLGSFNTLDVSKSWECFDNFLKWFNEQLLADHSDVVYLHLVKEEHRPKLLGKFSIAPESRVSPKYSAKTCYLSLKPRRVYKAPQIITLKDTPGKELAADEFLKGTVGVQKFFYKLQKDTKLFRRKNRAHKAFVAKVKDSRAKNAGVNQRRRERYARKVAAQNVREVIKFGGNTGHSYAKQVKPAQEIQNRQISKAGRAQEKRLTELASTDLDRRQLYKGLVQGLGWVGEGKYTQYGYHRAYQVWIRILRGCYANTRVRNDYEMYMGCRLSKKFMCFQTFAKWFKKHDDTTKNLPQIERLRVDGKDDFLLSTKCRISYLG